MISFRGNEIARNLHSVSRTTEKQWNPEREQYKLINITDTVYCFFWSICFYSLNVSISEVVSRTTVILTTPGG